MSLFRSLNMRALTWDKVFGEGGVSSARTFSGTRVSEESALKNSVVWASATLIADAVSSLTPEAITVDPETGAVTHIELPQWVRSPGPDLRRSDVMNQLVLSLLLWGNGFAHLIRRPSDGVIIGLLPINPKKVTVEWNPDQPGYRRYKIDNGPWLSNGDILHVQGPTLPGDAKGMSVISQAREAIGLGLTLEEFGARYFSQGSMAKVVIKIPGNTIDENKARQIVQTYERFHRGAGNWHRPAVLTGPAGSDIENISIPPEDAQFLQSREFQAVDVARWFRVPPHRVGIVSKQSSWGSGLAEENMAMVQHTFRPWILRIEEAFSSYAPGGEGRGMRIRLDVTDLLRGSFKELVDAWGGAVEKRIAVPNEARKALGLPPIEGGDQFAETPEPEPRPDPNVAARHMAGKHDQKKHGRPMGGINPGGTRLSDLSPKGRAAFDKRMAEKNLTVEGIRDQMISTIGRGGSGLSSAELLEAGEKWYPDANEFAGSLSAKYGISNEQAAAVISAVSPRCPWPRNKVLAERIVSRYNDPSIAAISDNTLAAKAIGGGLSANISPAVSVLRGGSIDSELTGPKRRSFYNNILAPGETDDVTVDVWMQRAMVPASGGILDNKSAEAFMSASDTAIGGQGSGLGAGYVAVAEATRQAADHFNTTPDAIQSAYWIAVSGSTEGRVVEGAKDAAAA